MRTTLVMAAASAALMGAPTPAHAVDGCTVLLCLAGNWKNIAQCVPPVQQAIRDVARGRGWPSCSMQSAPAMPVVPTAAAASAAGATTAGVAGSASAVQSSTDRFTCPPMYALYNGDNGAFSGCVYPGLISVSMNGALWAQVFFDASANTSTYYSPAARAALGPAGVDPTFDNDLARSASAPAPPTMGGGG